MYDRRRTIGASDAVQIAAGNWLDLYESKRQTEREPILAAEIGKALEPLNRQWFAQETGKEILYDPAWSDFPVRFMGKNPDRPPSTASKFDTIDWCVYTPDGLINEGGQKIPFEAKAVNPFWKTENLLAKYQPQLQHAMRVMHASYCYLSIFYLNVRWEWHKIPYDPAYDDHLYALERAFYWHLDNLIPPTD